MSLDMNWLRVVWCHIGVCRRATGTDRWIGAYRGGGRSAPGCYIYIYIYVYIYVIYLYLFIYLFIYTYTYSYTYTPIHIHMYIHIYIHTCVYIYIYIYIVGYVGSPAYRGHGHVVKSVPQV